MPPRSGRADELVGRTAPAAIEHLEARRRAASKPDASQPPRRAPLPASAHRTGDGDTDRDCFWQGGNRSVNVAYPDLGARYWVSAFPLPPGAELILRGSFPHSRYFSFNVYDPALRPTDALPDADIVADPGSTNPFVAGASRDAEPRAYTVRVVSGVPPAEREPNTIYLNAGGQGAVARTDHLPRLRARPGPRSGRRGRPAGGLAQAARRQPSSISRSTCAARDSAVGPTIDDLHANLDGPGTTPADPAAEDPIRWEAFFNYAQAFTYPLQATPAGAAREIVPRDSQGGFLSNVDNAYTFALANRGDRPGARPARKAPTVPPTVAGDPVMGAGQVRYWSLCENEFASQRVIDCVYDEQVQLGKRRRFTVVVSTPSATAQERGRRVRRRLAALGCAARRVR